ncbi:MAG: response regulator transcription factor [Bacilli bacterium]|jgi:DNA-binding response OmpR family regulator|nr:response regulator transcription factor [Bacilli bacterium]
MIRQTILVVEDEARLREVIINNLKEKYNIFEAQDGLEALQIFDEEHIDLVISDIMMPKMDGWELLSKIRERSIVPYIILSALDDEVSQIRGYDLTVDDYITKPFSPSILVKKVDAIFRRDSMDFEQKGIIKVGDLEINTSAKSVFVEGEETHLMPKEYDLLYFFIHNQDQALSRDYILNSIWGMEYIGDERVVDTHIKKLRKKMGMAAGYLKTVFGTGYKFQIESSESAEENNLNNRLEKNK